MNKLTFTSVGIMVGVLSANAAVIDFQALEVVNNSVNNVGTSVIEDGWMITKDAGEPFEFAVFGTLEARYPGSTALFNNTVNGMNRLEHGAFSVFDLVSIDLDFLNGSPTTVTFTGFINGGGTVLQAFTTDNAVGLETFNFAGFTNLTKVEWLQDNNFHQYDNIVVNVVPEPGTIVALMVGLALLASRRRRN